MIIVILIFILLCSFTVHLLSLIFFVVTKSKKLFNLFFATAMSNIMIGMALSIFAIQKPELIRSLDMKVILWVISGFIMILMLTLKIYIFRNIYKRTKDPAFYHMNYFGKKVYEKGIVKQYEFLSLVVSMPFFLFLGAYFVARLINLIMYGHI